MLLLLLVPVVVILAGCANSRRHPHVQGDPSGVNTGTRNDTVGATAGGPQAIMDGSGKVVGNDLERTRPRSHWRTSWPMSWARTGSR